MKKAAVIITLTVAMGLSIWFAVRNTNIVESYPESDFSIADRMATEASHILNNQATVVVIGIKGVHEHEDLVRIFTEKLKLVGNFHIIPALMTVDELKLWPDSETTGRITAENGFDPTVVFNLLNQHEKMSAIVSFAGPPALKDQDIRELQNKRIKMIVFAPATNNKQLKKLLEANIVQAAVIPRVTDLSPALTKRPETLNEWFDAAYEIITPARLAELSSPSPTNKR
jgi:hypothetical protein